MVFGVTIIEFPNNALGCQLYVLAPLPVSVVGKPAQIVDSEAVVATVGELTIIFLMAVLVHPLLEVPVTT